MNNLVQELKENNEDYEFYPTSKEMIKPIFDVFNGRETYLSFLDIGCGTCNFKTYMEELAEEDYQKRFEIQKERFFRDNPEKTEFDGNYSGYNVERKLHFEEYFVIEKSKILLDRLDRKTIVLGTNFHTDMLIDKPVKNIFCNPPYSEFKQWTYKILNEGNCFNIFMVIPKRWREDTEIATLIQKREIEVKSLGHFDFENAQRKARAKVEIVQFIKYHKRDRLEELENSSFDEWFNNEFNYSQDDEEQEEIRFRNFEQEQKEAIKNKLVCKHQDKAKMLVQFYEEDLNKLFANFKAISSLDLDVLETIGVDKLKIKEAVKQKTINLKNVYWELVFEEMEEITKYLTSDSRRSMLTNFTLLKKVDFTLTNIYSLIIWVIKNANNYYDDQLVKFYKDLSSLENIRGYKSNQKVFTDDDWRFSKSDKNTHYTLDYRIIIHKSYFGIDYCNIFKELKNYNFDFKINDIKVICENLGFKIYNIERPDATGKKYYAYGFGGEVMFEYKVFKNGNLHIKFNIELMKALNVEVARILGWIRNKEDIKKEFTEEMSKGAEKYFKVNNQVQLSNVRLLGQDGI